MQMMETTEKTGTAWCWTHKLVEISRRKFNLLIFLRAPSACAWLPSHYCSAECDMVRCRVNSDVMRKASLDCKPSKMPSKSKRRKSQECCESDKVCVYLTALNSVSSWQLANPESIFLATLLNSFSDTRSAGEAAVIENFISMREVDCGGNWFYCEYRVPFLLRSRCSESCEIISDFKCLAREEIWMSCFNGLRFNDSGSYFLPPRHAISQQTV